MGEFIKILLIVLAIILGALFTMYAIINWWLYPSDTKRSVNDWKQYLADVRSGKVMSMHFNDFLYNYKRDSKLFTTKRTKLMMLCREVRPNGTLGGLIPKQIHLVASDRIKYMSWLKIEEKAGNIVDGKRVANNKTKNDEKYKAEMQKAKESADKMLPKNVEYKYKQATHSTYKKNKRRKK